MEKAKIVLDALQGVKSNGVWRDYESDDGLDYRCFNWKDLIFFVRLERWNNGETMAGRGNNNLLVGYR